ncbi:membrane protein [Luteitalea sp. TBR-22]|uniref:KPN_02809 family neutral zinc metallopeptidase n=1 Tax=Luteitalea sp. TBR-22 TaxID=2802971 RepID=UPI001AF38B15|nr:membrane protein [Luteitalea sp. TBR-22]
MRWDPNAGPSRNIEDRRATSVGRGAGVGLGGMLILLVLSLLFGRDMISPVLQQQASQPQVQESGPLQTTPAEEKKVREIGQGLDDLQATWTRLLGDRYREATLVLFREATPSACGMGESAMGPFYCPGDQKVYLDLAFFDELDRRFGAPGDFAEQYVIAHEIGHHVQNLLGIERQVRALQQRNPRQQNQLSVLMELQADCFAGVWGHSTAQRGILEPGDAEEGLRAAASIGDDKLQSQATGRVRPESFTHGSSQQRVEWLTRGLKTGDYKACDTFASAAS